MDDALLHAPLVSPTTALSAAAPVSAAEAARLQALPPAEYWLEIARELNWMTPPEVALEGSFGDFSYFRGGTMNVSVNCLDRHDPQTVALHYEREDGRSETWSYGELTDAVARFAACLQDLGVTKGDRVGIYLSNCPEAFVAIQACYRIGAIYSVIFAGFSASAVRDRLDDAQPKVVVCTDATLRRGKVVPLKATLDDARSGIHSIEAVIVARRIDPQAVLNTDEHDFHTLLNAQTRRADPLPMEANEPGFIIYTSGTTSKPKGLVHSGVGFLVGTYANVKWALNLRPEDTYWCTADVGWLTFPIFALVGGLAQGATHVIYEGSIDTPTPERPYQMIEKYGVTKIFTAPTALRMLRRAGDAALSSHDLGTLQLIALVGEPLDPETWHWTQETLGGGRIFVNNTYGQTETGTAWASSMVGLTPTRPGACGQPLPGYRAQVVREDGSHAEPGELGYLTLTEPFPCLARTVWGDHERYHSVYLSEYPGKYAASDAALFDQDGQLWVTGRVDDVMNVAGHRIGTMEMEAALITHPAVSEAAVVARPDPIKGMVPVAFVVPRAGTVGSAELEQQLSDAIVKGVGSIARPARVIVVGTLPRTRSGKIMRRLLRDLLESGEVKGDLTSLENPDAIEVVRGEIAG
ncbi:acetate--CoA ligase [Deinococcus ruber]|uniref:acetate--CoA ligase n=1 Tax=Deinococcus ruber TaxID=1848197 RepID=A0A918BWR5_9DEIO|nr:acetate--CoA ligase [Deinococcus ruber]GGQ94740.1 acetyl-CoA synthase [Deinococcus ruber]